MNKLFNCNRGFNPGDPVTAGMIGSEDDMNLESVMNLTTPPLRKSPSEYYPEEISGFKALLAGTERLDWRNSKWVFEWCAEKNEKNALVWWLEKSRTKSLKFDRIKPEVLPLLGYVLCRNNFIEELSFCNLEFTVGSVEALGDALKQTRNLKKSICITT